jgi:glycogen synthase
MRILVLSNLYPPNAVGGYERLCHEVASGLVARGHALTVLTSRYGGEVAENSGQRILRELELLAGLDIYAPFPGTVEDRAAVNTSNVQILRRVLDDVRPDVVFAWNLFFFDASLLAALEASDYRTVVMLTDNWLLVMHNPTFVRDFFRDIVHGAAVFVPPPPQAAWRAVAGRAKRRVQRMAGIEPPLEVEAIFGSYFMRDFYAAGGVRFRSHRVIHNGVKQAQRGTTRSPDRARLVLADTLRLLFAGRLVDLKGADTAVKALALLDPTALGVHRITLTIVGDGQDLVYMQNFAETISCSGRTADIDMRPIVAEAELPALFDAHDIYLFTSLYEPFSLTLIYALACGIPTIASRVGGNLEIIRDGKSGLLFRKGDASDLAGAIARLAENSVLRARLASEGQEVGRRFSLERMVSEVEQFLRGPL